MPRRASARDFVASGSALSGLHSFSCGFRAARSLMPDWFGEQHLPLENVRLGRSVAQLPERVYEHGSVFRRFKRSALGHRVVEGDFLFFVGDDSVIVERPRTTVPVCERLAHGVTRHASVDMWLGARGANRGGNCGGALATRRTGNCTPMVVCARSLRHKESPDTRIPAFSEQQGIFVAWAAKFIRDHSFTWSELSGA